MQMNRKKAATLGGSAAIIGAAVALTAGTFSYFSDSKDSGTQSIQTGTLTLGVGGSSETADVVVDTRAPGWAATKTFQVRNTGTLPGTLYATLVQDSGNSTALADALHIEWNNGAGSLNDYTALFGAHPEQGTLQPGDSRTYTFAMSIPAEAGNAIQGKSVRYHFRFDLKQAGMTGPAVPVN